ncbi:hypothetical protein Celal_3605 [Cellulophaga algicola DSM 14237]|uniref:Uncharacterized protein n=1 Tax=Cellulophaga algicola (strain DSM 14237 / IC166 / ACAM 630) TaxID=688270 RepID=E6X951_CELAD|nr:hypothetical protein Celal_3605 [Cellulophaga algicola DSM 14237]
MNANARIYIITAFVPLQSIIENSSSLIVSKPVSLRPL